MPSQSVGNVHVSVPLSNLAVLYRPDLNGFIADQVCPPLPVAKENDLYYTWDQGPFFATDVDDLVPDRSIPRKIQFSHTTASYVAQKRELAWDVTDRERSNADNQLRLEQVKQEGVLGRLYLAKEKRVAALLRKTTNGGGLTLGANAGTKWDNASATFQTISSDVVAGVTAMRQAIGARPNVIVIPAAVVEGLHKSEFFVNVMQYTRGDTGSQPLYTSYPLLPPVLWGMRVLVPGQISNTAKEGQTASYADIWGEQVRMLYVTNGPALEEPSCAYSIQSRSLLTRRWREEEAEMDNFAVGYVGVEKVVAASAGYEIADCLT